MQVIAGKGTVIEGTIRVCYGCNNPVVLALTARGALLPLEPEPNETGGLAVSVPGPGRAPLVRYLRGDDRPAAGEQRMTAHWDLHPACKGKRKKRRNHENQAATELLDRHETQERQRMAVPQMRALGQQSGAAGLAPPEAPQVSDETTQAQLEAKAREIMMGHIDPATGRNKRERGKLQKMVNEGSKGGAIRRTVGTAAPRERRIDQKRRNKTGRG